MIGVELVAVGHAVAASVHADVHGGKRDVDTGEALTGEAAQYRVVIARDVGHARAARGVAEDLGQHLAVCRMPERRQLDVFEVDDVTDEVQPLAGSRAQEIKQVRCLTVAQTQVDVGDEDAAKVQARHGGGSGFAQPSRKV